MDVVSSPFSLVAAEAALPRVRRRYALRWRRHWLIVESVLEHCNPNRSWVVEDEDDRIRQCLARSPAQGVLLDPQLAETDLQFWAELCQQTGKTAYLRLPSMPGLPQRSQPWAWWLKGSIDRGLAALLLALLGPVFWAIALLILFTTPGPIFLRQWCVGQRGQLFQGLKFRSVAVAEAMTFAASPRSTSQLTPLGQWLLRYGLDALPQLINVLRGDMSLVGPQPWALADVARIEPEQLPWLNALPGMIGLVPLRGRSLSPLADGSAVLELESVRQLDPRYFKQWSLFRDLNCLLRSIPRAFSEFEVY